MNSSMFLMPTNCNEVQKVIKSLKDTNSTGYDQIPTKIIKFISPIIAPILEHLINLSLYTGVFPDKLKISVIKPIYKKGSKKLVDNYRPIALLPILAKIYEKIMHSRLTSFIDKFQILKKEQNGFQKNKSTTLAAFTLMNLVSQNIDNKIPTTVIFFDMSKAFDFVSHDLLLKKCEKFGIRGKANAWLKSYLTNRSQFVEITVNKTKQSEMVYKSSLGHSRTGVPQGSILGPLLFLLYINDLIDVTNYPCILFADDVSVIIPKINENYNIEINNTVNKIIKWMESNNLKPNIGKTKYIQFTNKNWNKIKLKITYEDKVIEKTDNITFLGIVIDEKCSWSNHINKVCEKLAKFAYALWRLSNLTTKQATLQAYHAYVGSVLRYGILVWGNSVHIEKALISQNRCVRAICNVDPLTSCKPLFKKLRILTVACVYIEEICKFTKSHSELFEKVGDNCNFKTRFPNKLTLPKMRTELYKRSCFPMCIQIYNKLPVNIRELPMIRFKKALRRWLIDNPFYSIKEFLQYKFPK